MVYEAYPHPARGWELRLSPVDIANTTPRSERLALFSKSFQARSATQRVPSLSFWKRSSHSPSLSIFIRMTVSALSAKPWVRVPTCGPHCKQCATIVVTRHSMLNTVRLRFIVYCFDVHVSLEGFKVFCPFSHNHLNLMFASFTDVVNLCIYCIRFDNNKCTACSTKRYGV